jgi:hypothetical protein
MKGLPTTYNGVRFRSRLEAKWAFMFDEFGWDWQYEPFDLDGYIPDFSLGFYKPFIVEIKPLIDKATLFKARGKIVDSGWKGEAAILSHTIDSCPYQPCSEPMHGSFLDSSYCPGSSEGFVWEEFQLFRCRACKKVSICSKYGIWTCRVCGEYDGDGHIDALDGFVQEKWAIAGNRFQWRAE